MKYDFVCLNEACVTGIIHPVLIVDGNVEKENYNFILEINGEELDVNVNKNSNKFSIRYLLNRNQKNIKLYLNVDNEKLLILQLKTSMLRRLKYKLSRKFKILTIIFGVIKRGFKFLWKEYHFLVPPKLWKKYINDFKSSIKRRMNGSIFYNPMDVVDYNKWLSENKKEVVIEKQEYNPLISFIIPVYNINRTFLSECIDSILNQTYQNFEICLADDCSTNKETIDTLKEYEKKDKRIKVVYRKQNGHISEASNSALKIANGEFIALMDDDDLLDSNALYENILVLNNNKNIDFIYSDEDKLNLKGKYCEPHFKPDFSPDTLLSCNYICHFSVIRKSLVEEVGGFEKGLEGAQDHDLFLKVTEKTNNIYHISKILYHWRMVEGSTSMSISNKSYAMDKGKIAIENALKRRNIKASVERDPRSTYYIVHYELSKEPLVSIIIPTRDYADITRKCIESIYEKTTYKNFEIILANNNSEKEETFALFDEMKQKHNNFKIIDVNIEFNYSKINNIAVKEAKGEYIVLLNNDTEVISTNWLTEMIGYASQKHIGTVGVKLLYPDMTVQHAGVILGLGGVASHAYLESSREDLGLFGRLCIPYDYAANTAACIAISKEKFLEVGGLEEELKVAYNDIDFNLKLLEKGYYNVTLSQIELLHYESKSRGLDTTTEKYKRFLTESEFMWNKWEPILNNDPFYNSNFSKKGWFELDKK